MAGVKSFRHDLKLIVIGSGFLLATATSTIPASAATVYPPAPRNNANNNNNNNNNNRNNNNNNGATAAKLNAANSAVDTARDAVQKALTDFNNVVTRLISQIDDDAGVKDAVAARVAAQKAYDTERQSVLAKLDQDAGYESDKNNLTNAELALDKLKNSGDAKQEDIVAAAQHILVLGNLVSQHETNALADDPQAVLDHTALVEASANEQTLRTTLEKAISQAPDWVTTHNAVTDAQTKLSDAEAALDKEQAALAAAQATRARAMTAAQARAAARARTAAVNNGMTMP